MMPFDRRSRVMAISVGLPRSPEGDKGCVGGSPGRGDTTFGVDNTASGALIVCTDVFELAAKLLQIRLLF